MAIDPDDIQRIAKFVTENLDAVETWVIPEGYPSDLACCVIDSIYSTGSHYASVQNVIANYRANTDNDGTISSLKASIVNAGGPLSWADKVVRNNKPAHTGSGALLKAEVIDQAADLLLGLGIETVDDLKAAVADDPTNNPVHTGWKKLPSQSSGTTYNYLLLLSDLPSVKPDRMIHRFLKMALGSDRSFTNLAAVDLIREVASEIGVSPSTLDHNMWRFASGRTAISS